MASLARKTLDGAALNVSTVLFKTLIQFMIVLPILARMIPPEQFGYVAMAMAFVGFFTMFNDLGISAALVRADAPSAAFWSTAFWVNLGLGAAMTLCTVLAAPAIAAFYQEPIVEPLVQALSVMVIMHCIFLVPMAWLQRNFRFRTIASIDLISTILSAVTALVAAAQGLGMWALVLQQVVLYFVKMLGSLAAQRAPLALVFKPSEIVAVLPFSLRLTGEAFVTFINRNADNILIGRFLGAAPLGFYGRAYQIMLVPVSSLSLGVGYALYPAMSSIKHEPERLGNAYLKSLAILAGISFPMMTGLAMVSEPFVALVFGPDWTAVVPVLSVLAFVGIVQTIIGPSSTLWKALGNSQMLLRWALIRMFGFVLAFSIGVNAGSLVALAAAYLAANVLLFIPFQWLTLKELKLPMSAFIGAVLPSAVSSAIMAAVLAAVRASWPGLSDVASVLQLAVLVPIGVAVFALTMMAGFRPFVADLWSEGRKLLGAQAPEAPAE
ncbi:MAG: lipopolysaccharide biosynthesis protein [Pseudomonadota bacterium]